MKINDYKIIAFSNNSAKISFVGEMHKAQSRGRKWMFPIWSNFFNRITALFRNFFSKITFKHQNHINSSIKDNHIIVKKEIPTVKDEPSNDIKQEGTEPVNQENPSKENQGEEKTQDSTIQKIVDLPIEPQIVPKEPEKEPHDDIEQKEPEKETHEDSVIANDNKEPDDEIKNQELSVQFSLKVQEDSNYSDNDKGNDDFSDPIVENQQEHDEKDSEIFILLGNPDNAKEELYTLNPNAIGHIESLQIVSKDNEEEKSETFSIKGIKSDETENQSIQQEQEKPIESPSSNVSVPDDVKQLLKIAKAKEYAIQKCKEILATESSFFNAIKKMKLYYDLLPNVIKVNKEKIKKDQIEATRNRLSLAIVSIEAFHSKLKNAIENMDPDFNSILEIYRSDEWRTYAKNLFDRSQEYLGEKEKYDKYYLSFFNSTDFQKSCSKMKLDIAQTKSFLYERDNYSFGMFFQRLLRHPLLLNDSKNYLEKTGNDSPAYKNIAEAARIAAETTQKLNDSVPKPVISKK